MNACTEQRRQPGATAPEAALSELVSLARDLGIPASPPRVESEVRGLAEAIRERIHTKARDLAFHGLHAGQSLTTTDND